MNQLISPLIFLLKRPIDMQKCEHKAPYLVTAMSKAARRGTMRLLPEYFHQHFIF